MCTSNNQHAQQAVRYLRGDLSPDEAAIFEVALIDNPKLFAEVQLQQQLIMGLQDYALKQPARNHRNKRSYRLFNLSLAAAIVFMVTVICSGQSDYEAPPTLAGPPGRVHIINAPDLIAVALHGEPLFPAKRSTAQEQQAILILHAPSSAQLLVLAADTSSAQLVSTQHHL
jgi:hypothetical protein